MFVCDSVNHRVVRWDEGAAIGTLVAGGNGHGLGRGQLNYPAGVALSLDGAVLVVDKRNGRVVKWRQESTEGEVVAGGTEAHVTSLLWPYFLAVDRAGAMLVSDVAKGHVTKWVDGATTGEVVAEGELGGKPSGIAVARDGALLVAETNRHLSLIHI